MGNVEVHEIRCARASLPRSSAVPTPAQEPTATARVFGWPEMEIGTEAAVMAAAAEAATAEAEAAEAVAAARVSDNPPPSYVAWEEESHRARNDPDRTRDRLEGRHAEAQGRGRGGISGARAQQSETAVGDGGTGIRGGAAAAETQSPPPQWACSECTFLNDREVFRCEMCGARIPMEERPPDSTRRDILIDDSPLDWERFRQLARRHNEAVRTIRVGSGGGGGGTGGGSSMSDAAAGSAIGAIGAGVASAMMSPSVRPGRMLSSMMQGALLGGVAGAAIGPELRRTPSGGSERGTRASRREDPHNLLDLESLYANHERRQAASSTVHDAAVGADRDGSRHAMANHLHAMRDMRDLETTMLRDALQRVALSDLRGRPGVVLRVRRRVNGDDGGHGGWYAPESESNQPAAAASIANLPEEVLSRESLARMPEDGRQCCICLEQYRSRDVVTRLPCLHVYHGACIKNWLQTSGTCPQCKRRVD